MGMCRMGGTVGREGGREGGRDVLSRTSRNVAPQYHLVFILQVGWMHWVVNVVENFKIAVETFPVGQEFKTAAMHANIICRDVATRMAEDYMNVIKTVFSRVNRTIFHLKYSCD